MTVWEGEEGATAIYVREQMECMKLQEEIMSHWERMGQDQQAD